MNAENPYHRGWLRSRPEPHSAPMSLDTGGRFSLRLREPVATHAAYAVELSTRDGTWSTDAVVSVADGTVECAALQGVGEPPSWLVKYARAALRGAWRAHGEQGWPRRLTRWRDTPARAGSGGSPEE